MPIYLVLSEMAKVEFKEGTVLELIKKKKKDVGWFVNVVNNLLRRWADKRKYYEGLIDKNGE